MKFRLSQIFIYLFFISSFFIEQTKAADFSQAQQTYVPPSLIQRGINALGLNGGTLPGLGSGANPNTANDVNANTPGALNLDSVLNGIINPASQSPATSPTPDPSANVTSSTWSKVQGLASQAQNIPGLSTPISKIQNRVSTLLQSGKYGDAENVARAGLKYFPNNSLLKTQFAAATVAEAQALILARNYDLAGKKAREALVADPNNKKAKVVIGKVLRAQALDPSTAEGHVAAADDLVGNGRLLESSVEYKLALEIKPNAPAHVGLGNLAIGKGQIIAASNHFERALAIDPNCALAYRQRGALRYVMQDIGGANSDFGKAVSLNPHDPLAANALIGLWTQQVANAPSSANSHLGLARAYLQTNNLDAARSEYKTVVAIDPNNPALPAARASFKAALAKQTYGQYMQPANTLNAQGAFPGAAVSTPAFGNTNANAFSGSAMLPQTFVNVNPNTAFPGAPPAMPSVNQSLLVMPNNSAPVINNSTAYPNLYPNSNPFPNPATNPANGMPNPAINNPAAYPTPNPLPNSNTAPNPAPNNGIDNIPLKSPITPVSPNQSYNPFGNGYYSDPQAIYYTNSAEVNTLANLASFVRALIISEKLGLQSNGKNVYGSSSLPGNPPSYISNLNYPE